MSVTETVLTGSMLLAVPLAVLAGLVSFLSPCVLPLVPGYLGYVSGMAGAGSAVRRPDALRRGETRHAVGPSGPRLPGPAAPTGTATLDEVPRSRLVLGTLLFVLGFTVVFVGLGVAAGSVGAAVVRWSDVVTRVLGVVVVLLGLSFLGWLPLGRRERRVHLAPRAGLWGAPLLGLVFGLGWVPCIGPTLVAVYTLALDEASAGRGAVLAVAYCVGLGLPFVLAAVGLERSRRVLRWLTRHQRALTVLGGALLVAMGLALVTGAWSTITGMLQGVIGGFETVL